MVAGGGSGSNGKLVTEVQSFSWGGWKISRGYGDGCTTIGMYLILPSVYLKMAKMGNVLLCIFYCNTTTNKKTKQTTATSGAYFLVNFERAH